MKRCKDCYYGGAVDTPYGLGYYCAHDECMHDSQDGCGHHKDKVICTNENGKLK